MPCCWLVCAATAISIEAGLLLWALAGRAHGELSVYLWAFSVHLFSPTKTTTHCVRRSLSARRCVL